MPKVSDTEKSGSRKNYLEYLIRERVVATL